MNFSAAIALLDQGKKVQRTGWNTAGIFLEKDTSKDVENPDAEITDDDYYITIDTTSVTMETVSIYVGRTKYYPGWVDMKSDDWVEVV